jgi:hypothetical protein
MIARSLQASAFTTRADSFLPSDQYVISILDHVLICKKETFGMNKKACAVTDAFPV